MLIEHIVKNAYTIFNWRKKNAKMQKVDETRKTHAEIGVTT